MLFKNATIVGENYDVIENGYLLTENEKITYIGTTPPNNYTGEIYDAKNKVLFPGFVNTHCHIPMTLLRGYGEGLSLQDWLFTKIFPFEDLLTQDDCYWGSLLGSAEMIASGVSSFNDMYFFMEGITRAVEQSGLKANLARCFSCGLDSKEKVADMDYLFDFANKSSTIKADFSIHAEYTTNEAIITELSDYCNEHKLIMQVHISETKSEHENCKQKYGITPVELFNKLGTFNSKTTAAHCVWVEQGDMEILADKGVSVAHCPSSNLKLGSGIAPVLKMIDTGINVTIGTDGASSNNNLNMLEEVTLTALVQRGANQDPSALQIKELLTLACKNGALSQGREDCGELKVGNRADIVVYDLDKPHLQPVFDVCSNILFSGQASDIALNMVDGKVLYKDGVFLTIDIEKAKYNVARVREEKLKQLAK